MDIYKMALFAVAVKGELKEKRNKSLKKIMSTLC